MEYNHFDNDYSWDTDGSLWDDSVILWEDATYNSYVRSEQNTLYVSGEYIILSHSIPYTDIGKITGFKEVIEDKGSGTILKKEFRFSYDGDTFSEFQELTETSIQTPSIKDEMWFQYRYILLSGGPVTVKKVYVTYDVEVTDPTLNYVAPAIQDESRIYAFPVIYKSNFLWEPYKLNRAIRLYKDLNLMVNSLFGHDVEYYRVLPQGRSMDVFLMEYSLYDHADSVCMKVVVPNNEFPDNKLNMGPFGTDFELPFEVQMDKDYYQKIFGNGTGPQKRDVIHFPRTNRIYEVASSYLYRDFMNEPLYFKVTLIKWLPKSNVEQNDSLNTLEKYTNSAGRLFGEQIEQEETKNAKPEQYNVASTFFDPVRQSLYNSMKIQEEKLLNYYTVVSEYFYDLRSVPISNIKVKLDGTFEKDKTYFARVDPISSQPDLQYYYSMKKLTYLGNTLDGESRFSVEGGGSNIESSFKVYSIFGPTSSFYMYEKEYIGLTSDVPVGTCISTVQASHDDEKVVEYKATNAFCATEDRAFSCWFRIQDTVSTKPNVTSVSFDVYTREATIVYDKTLELYYDDTIAFKRESGNFVLFGKVKKIISVTSVIVEFEQESLDFVQSFGDWTAFTDLRFQVSVPRVFIDSRVNGKGLRIELVDNRYLRVFINDSIHRFNFPNNIVALATNEWYSIFVNISNTFKQLTMNVWQRQWHQTTNLPATTDLKLVLSKMVTITPVDVTTVANYFLLPSSMDLTNIRLYNRTAETDKQPLVLNQNIVKDAQWSLIIDNALPQSKLPHVGYTR